ncbi:MAG: DUF116 domain-containing protein [Planctomycetota bacterium]
MGKKLDNIIIGLNNFLRGRKPKRLAPEKVMLLFSHCLQYSKCPQKIVNDLAECKRCGKCSVKDILEMSERYGVKCAVASGSEMALEKVNAADVDAVIAIACQKELAGGIKAIFPKKVLAVPNTRPHGPCKDCGVDIQNVEAFLKKTISK